MNKIITLSFILLIATSCINSNERKAKKLIKDYLNSSMNDYSSYESVEFSKLDTLYSYFRFEEEYRKMLNDYTINEERIKTMQETTDKANEFNKRVGRILDRRGIVNEPFIQDAEEENQILYKRMYEYMRKYKPKMIGYKMYHKFRGSNSFGGVILVKWLFCFDKEISKVTETLSEETIKSLEQLKELDRFELKLN